MTRIKEISTEEKLKLIVDSIKEKKGKQITSIDLTKIHNSLCDYFVICHGDSTTQVDALTEGVLRKVKDESGVRPHHVEGTDNCHWVLIDYYDVLVHVFLGEMRKFYKLEELWADGDIEVIEDEK